MLLKTVLPNSSRSEALPGTRFAHEEENRCFGLLFRRLKEKQPGITYIL